MSAPQADFRVANHGTIFVLTPKTEAAKTFIASRMPDDVQRWGRDGYVVEHRYIADILVDLHENDFSFMEGV